MGVVASLARYLVPLLRIGSSNKSTLLTGPFSKIMQESGVTDPFVQRWFDYLAFALSGLDAAHTQAAAVAYMMRDLHQKDAVLDYPMGGMGALIQALVEGLEKHNGGQLRLNSRVERILLDDNGGKARATGVQLADGTIIRARKGVVSNAPLWNLARILQDSVDTVETSPKSIRTAVEEIRQQYPEIFRKCQESATCFLHTPERRNTFDVPKAEREAFWEHQYNEPGFSMWVGGFRDMMTNRDANDEVSEFVAKKIRERVKNPKVADLLIPADHGFGTRRVPLENGYYDMFNRDNVSLVDLKETPIECITPKGIRTSAGEIELDVIVLATGFDAGTGGLTAIDIRGRDGVSLREQWKTEVRTTMGLQIHGYPNLFTTSAPYAPAAAFCNAPTCLQHQVQWITECIAHLQKTGRRIIEPNAETEAAWLAHHDELAEQTLVAKTKSWYTGANVEGKPQRLLSYIGGVPAYREACEKVRQQDYEGFETA